MSNQCSKLPVRFMASVMSLCAIASVICCGRPAGRLVRFVVVMHPTRGSCILMCTDTSLSAVDIIRLYGLRFKIEHSFKQATRQIGSFAYHFWMKDMIPLRYHNGNQFLHRKSAD